MWTAALLAVLATALGAALGLVRDSGRGAVRVLQLAAVAGAALVVFLQLLPDALGAIGIEALAAFVLAAALPALLERASRAGDGSGKGGERLGLELGYAGLLVHKLGDGLVLGAVAAAPGAPGDELKVALAIAAHTVPMTAVVVLAFADRGGVGEGAARALGIAAAILAGIAAAGAVPVELLARSEGWLDALVAGLLFHVILHEAWSVVARGAARPVGETP
jgi:hypothetical protein